MKQVMIYVAAMTLASAAFAEVPQFGSDTTRVMTVIATATQGLNKPTDLAFNPDIPEQLWTVNQGFNGTIMFVHPGANNQTIDKRIDSYSSHFMSNVSSITFGDRTFKDKITFATCQDSRNGGNDFMGPTLWPSDLSIYARVNQNGPLLGSHIDMLHQSPLCKGITHDKDNVFWVTDGKNGHVVRYDFAKDHGPGHDDHSDGIVRRYPEAKFTAVTGITGHLVLDKASSWLYVADTGGGRVYKMNTLTGTKGRNLQPQGEPLHEFSEWKGITQQVLLTGLNHPAGITIHSHYLFVSLNGTGEIVAYDLDDSKEAARIQTGAKGISGLTVGPDEKLWFVDTAANKVIRIDP